uniref:Anaphase-promoting complex subunit 7 n=1 Tax=Oncorhynchus tshawytscha TaxID=74940 RepID=A0AAZ3SMD1_ONCTS
MNVIDHVRDMAAAGLHSNVRIMSSLLLTMSNNNPELFSPSQKYQLLVYHADAIFHDKEYRNAACKYNMALQQKKVLSKTSKVRPSTGGTASSIQSQILSGLSRDVRSGSSRRWLRFVVLLEGEPSLQSEVLSALEQVFIKDLCTLL